MNRRARNFIGAVALVFLLTPFGARADENPIGILLAAGDIVTCVTNKTKSGKATADLIKAEIAKADALSPKVEVRVLALGDLVYEHGAKKGFDECFHKTWGQFKDKILPVPGNHDYETAHGAPYFKYFEKTLQGLKADKQLGYYSVEFPPPKAPPENNTSWQIIAFNSNDETGSDQTQVKWLESELIRTKAKRCVLAFSHAFFYSSGRHGHADKDKNGKPQNGVIDLIKPLLPGKEMHDMFRLLHAHRASVLLAGHDHHFEQLGRANAEAKPADYGQAAMVPDGVRSFVVGTGGKRLHSEPKIGDKLGNDYTYPWAFREAYDLQSYGILKIELLPTSYRWKFVSTDPSSTTMQGDAKNVTSDNCNRLP
jgi:hypothetical protein